MPGVGKRIKHDIEKSTIPKPGDLIWAESIKARGIGDRTKQGQDRRAV
jgi:hypothetical protein